MQDCLQFGSSMTSPEAAGGREKNLDSGLTAGPEGQLLAAHGVVSVSLISAPCAG